MVPLCLLHSKSNGSGRGYVIFLDQDGVKKPDSMVAAAAAEHGVFLRQAQSGQGLARVENPGAGTFYGVHVAPCPRRGPGQRLQEIQRCALAAEQRAGRAL